MPYGSKPPNMYQNRVQPVPMPQEQSYSPWTTMMNALPGSLGEVQQMMGIQDMTPSKRFNNSAAPQQNSEMAQGIRKVFKP